jgi:hypothetical protein
MPFDVATAHKDLVVGAGLAGSPFEVARLVEASLPVAKLNSVVAARGDRAATHG